MFKRNQKIRDLEKALQDGIKNPAMAELLEAINKNAPKQARAEFRDNLKAKLLNSFNMRKAEKHDREAGLGFQLWRDLRFRGWAVALAGLILVVLGAVISYPLIPAPTVQGYLLKGATREMSANAPFQITFSQLMDHGSVEKNFQIEPIIPGKFRWKGNTMIYETGQTLKDGDVYKITIGEGALSLLRKPLASEYSEFYKIVKSPQVALITPNDGSVAVPVDSKINIMFDRPMTGLTTLGAGRQNFPAVKLEPAVRGRWKWLGTSTMQFIPESLQEATSYRVVVPAGTEVLDGGRTENEVVASFETARPELIQMWATDSQTPTEFSPRSKIKLTFNQKVDLASATSLIKLKRLEKGQEVEEVLRVRYFTEQDYRDEQNQSMDLQAMNQMEEIKEESGVNTAVLPPSKPTQAELSKSLIVESQSNLQVGLPYRLTVMAGIRGAAGPLTTLADQNFEIPAMMDLQMTGAGNVEIAPDSDVTLARVTLPYNARMDLRSFRDKITVNPPVKDEKGLLVKANVTTADSPNNIRIDYDYQPATDYTITVAAGVKDIFGRSWNQPAEIKFRTPNFRPALLLETGTDISVVDGSKPSHFYLKSTNIDYADVKLKNLSRDEFVSFYGSGWLDYAAINISGEGNLWTGRLPIKLATNQRGHTLLDLDKLTGAKLSPGFYQMEISNPAVLKNQCDYQGVCQKKMKVEKTLFVVSKSALAVKFNTKEMLVWSTNLSKGEPVKDMKISVLGIGGNATSDASGLARITLADTDADGGYRDYLIFGETADGDISFAHSTWSEGIAPWNFGINSESIAPEYYGYVYTDRPIYRPDQEVFFKGIVRQEKQDKFRLPTAKTVQVTIDDPLGNRVLTKDLPLSSNGTFSGSLKLGKNINSGDYYMRAMLTDVTGPEWLRQFTSSFRVYEYRKPEYKLDLITDRPEYVNGEQAKVTVNAGYFFGAPLPKAKVSWNLQAKDYYFILPEELAGKLAGSWFSFASEGLFCYWGCQSDSRVVSQGEVQTDEKGNAQIVLPLNLNDQKISQIYTLEVRVQDANNQGVSSRISIPVHKGEIYVGVRSRDYVVNAGQPAAVEVLAVSREGRLQGGQAVELSLFERNWNTVKRKNVDGDFYFENSYEDKLVEKKQVTTSSEGLAVAEFNLKKGGNYLVEAVGRDSRGNVVSSSTSIYASTGEFVNWGNANNDKIELIADKMEYQVGETARVLIKSPYRGVYALVTYEKDRVLDQKVIKLNSNTQTIEIPVTEKFLPNVFVSVVLAKGNSYDAGLMAPPNGEVDDRKVAGFKVGYTTLQVNTASKRLNVNIKSDKERYAPGEKVRLQLNSTDLNGKPVPAELSVAVVDESVLSLTESVTADLLNVFYRRRLLAVNIAHTLTKAISRVNVQVEAGLKGGGGGSAAKRGTFKDTAYFQANLQTDANGQGALEFTLPDNLTTWKVAAIGISNDSGREARSLVGSGQHSFLANKDILLRPVLPRFATSGDEMEVAAIVHNYTSSEQRVRVGLDAQGMKLRESREKIVNIKSGQSSKVTWKVLVESAPLASVNYQVLDDKGGVADSVAQALPLKAGSLPEEVAMNTVVSGENKEIEKVWLPAGLDLSQGQLRIEIAATLSGALQRMIDELRAMPYGHTEALSSSLLANSALKKLTTTSKWAADKWPAKDLDARIQSDLQQLYKLQHPDGSFGMWMNSMSSPYLTAQVLNAMQEARAAGMAIDENIWKNTLAYLNKQADRPLNQEGLTPDEKAFILYALSEAGQNVTAFNNNLYAQLAALDVTGRAYLAMAYQLSGQGDAAAAEKVNALKKALENAAQQTPRGVSFRMEKFQYSYFDTQVKTDAIALKTLQRLDSNNPLIPKIISSLFTERKGGRFATSQENALALEALLEYLGSSGELAAAYQAQVMLNGREVLKEKFTSENLTAGKTVDIALRDLLADNLDNEIALQKTGLGKMYTDITLKYFLPLLEQVAANEGLEVEQEYFTLEDLKMEKPLDKGPAGATLRAKMTVIVPEDRHYVLVEDMLPAGLEGIDFNLKTSDQSLDDGKINDCIYDCADWYFNHFEVKDDRVTYFADFLPRGVYEIEYYVRATTPGKFADLPAVAKENFYPEVFGRSSGKEFVITP